MSDSADKPILQARGLHRTLGEGDTSVHVLKGVGLEVFPGKTYAIAGPSGCGKSTLLYLLGLLDRQDKGDIWIDGKPMSTASDELRTAQRCEHIGFVFQFHFLLPEFTAAENIMLPMRKLGSTDLRAMRSRAEELLGHVGLREKADRLANQLSGGEQQRVAVARALANKPSILLADEPTGNLDVANSDAVFGLLKKLAVEQNLAVLMVTHNPDLAKRADILLQMQDGLFV